MASVFSRIIAGELPGHFVYRDDRCLAFLSIHPLKPGHTLVVPIEEIDHWIDLSPELNRHLFQVAQGLARRIQEVFQPAKVALLIAGLEVPHVHLHLVPIDGVHDLDFERQDRNPSPESLLSACQRISEVVQRQGLQ